MRTAQWIRSIAVASVLVLATFACAQETTPPPAPPTTQTTTTTQTPSEPAGVLVRRAVEKEEKPNSREVRFMFKLRSVTPKLTSVKEMIETNQGLVARLLSVNDQPLTDDQRAKEEDRLNKLVNDPSEQARKQKQQEQDDARARKLLAAIPDAFLFEYDGTEPGKNGPLVRVKFKPNPNFHPPSRETQVFTGMEGTMWLDQRQERLVKIDGTLFQDINFGWGALAHLDKGGRFVVEQSYLGDGRWDTTGMQLDFNGKAFFGLKTIKIRQNETMYDYHEVPSNLSVAQGIELLRKQPNQVAEKAAQ